MTTYNTGNPLGSTDVFDRYDNSENLDYFSNGQLDAYPDRLGVLRQSLQGIRNASQYQVIGAYAAGLQITALNQAFSYLGEYYVSGPSIVLPYTTTGIGAAEIANFRSVGDAILRSDLADGADSSNGAALVGYKGRNVASRFAEHPTLKDFGAIGDGVADDTSAIQAAVNYSAGGLGVLVTAGTYKLTSTIIADDKYFKFFGVGVGASVFLYSPEVQGVAFSLLNTPLSDKSFSFSDLSIVTDVASCGTAILVEGKLTAEPVQVNGENNSLILSNVTVSQIGTGYWTTFVHSKHNGGVLASNLTLDNTLTAAQSNPAVRGIVLENTDTRVSTIRSLYLSNYYILRVAVGLDLVGNNTTQIESVYLTTGELVGASEAGIRVTGRAGAFGFVNGHYDCNKYVLDSRAGNMLIGHFIGCDFRKGGIGGIASTPGPMFAIDAGEMLAVTGCNFSGNNHVTSNALNKAFGITNTVSGVPWYRSTITGCTFRNLYYVFGPSLNSKINSAGNTYNAIQGTVIEDNNFDSSIALRDAIVTKGLSIALDNTGTQTVNVPVPANVFTSAWPCAMLQVAGASGADNLTARYDFEASTASNCVFIVKGNLTARSVRFSFMASGTIEPTMV